MQVLAEHVAQRVIALVFLEPWLDLGQHARLVAIAPVEDLALVQHDGLVQPVGGDVVGQLLKVFPFEQREEVRVLVIAVSVVHFL